MTLRASEGSCLPGGTAAERVRPQPAVFLHPAFRLLLPALWEPGSGPGSSPDGWDLLAVYSRPRLPGSSGIWGDRLELQPRGPVGKASRVTVQVQSFNPEDLPDLWVETRITDGSNRIAVTKALDQWTLDDAASLRRLLDATRPNWPTRERSRSRDRSHETVLGHTAAQAPVPAPAAKDTVAMSRESSQILEDAANAEPNALAPAGIGPGSAFFREAAGSADARKRGDAASDRTRAVVEHEMLVLPLEERRISFQCENPKRVGTGSCERYG